VAQVISHRFVTVEAWAQFQASPRDISGGQCGTETSFSLSIFVLPCLYHSTSALHPSSSICGSYKKVKWENFGEIPESYALSEIMEH
jgi:hypothetical protein